MLALPTPALHRTQDGVPPRPGPPVLALQAQADGTGQVQVSLPKGEEVTEPN